MISPVLDQGATSVQAYVPDSKFYNYYDGSVVATRGETVTLDAPMNYIPLHIHGGNILPTQEPARNTEAARNNPFGLIVALDVIHWIITQLFTFDSKYDSYSLHVKLYLNCIFRILERLKAAYTMMMEIWLVSY